MKKRVLSFGELLWDLLPEGAVLGGAPFNFAYRIQSLGSESFFVSCLGEDEYGEQALKKVSELGLNTEYIQFNPEKDTGTVKVFFDENKNPDYLIVPDVAYDVIQFNTELENLVETIDCFCFGTLAQRAVKSRETLYQLLEMSSKAVKFLDINLRKKCYSKETLEYSLKKADILKLNEDELKYIGAMLDSSEDRIDDLCKKMIDIWKLKICIITLGDQGSFVMSDEGEKVYEPGYQIQLEDPLGAGDAFSAAFLHHYLNRYSVQECCEFGNVLGALAASQAGATVPISRDDISTFESLNLKRSYHSTIKQIM